GRCRLGEGAFEFGASPVADFDGAFAAFKTALGIEAEGLALSENGGELGPLAGGGAVEAEVAGVEACFGIAEVEAVDGGGDGAFTEDDDGAFGGALDVGAGEVGFG